MVILRRVLTDLFSRASCEFTCHLPSILLTSFRFRKLLNSTSSAELICSLHPAAASPIFSLWLPSICTWSHQASVCMLCSCHSLKYLVFLWPHSHFLWFGGIYTISPFILISGFRGEREIDGYVSADILN